MTFGGLRRTTAPVDAGTEQRFKRRALCGIVARNPETNVLHSCTRAEDHPGTDYDQDREMWFGKLADGTWKFIPRSSTQAVIDQRGRNDEQHTKG